MVKDGDLHLSQYATMYDSVGALETIEDVKEQKVKEYSTKAGKPLAARPFRANDFNTTLNVLNRHWNTTGISTPDIYLLNATAGIRIPADTFFLILGFKIIDEDAAPLGADSMVQVFVDGVFKAEIAPICAKVNKERVILMLDAAIEAYPNQTLEIKIRSPTASPAVNAVIIPIGYCIQTEATARVS